MRMTLAGALLAVASMGPALAQTTTTNGRPLTAAEIALGLLSGTIKQTATFSAAGGAAAGQSTVIGSGPDALTLQVSQQRYQGDAVATVLVDGQPAGTFAVSALRGQGADTVTLRGNWGAGQPDVQVVFEDAFDANADWSDPNKVMATGKQDRNVFVEGMTYNGQTVSGGTLALYNSSSASSVSFTGVAAYTASGRTTVGTVGGSTTMASTGAGPQTGGAPQAVLSGDTPASGGMTDEQLAAVRQYLNGGRGAELTPGQAAAVTAGNPLLAAAAAQGHDTTAAAGQVVAQAAAGQTAPSLPGFTVQWMEDFTSGKCTGLLSNVWGPGVRCPGPGVITLSSTSDNQDSGAMTRPEGYGSQAPGGGWGYGFYSFTLKVTGAAKPGPYAQAWPGTDVWPGPELDVMEVLEDGTPYGTVHWKGGSGDNQFRSVRYEGVNVLDVHTYAMLWLPGQIRFYVDGKQYGDAITENVPADGAHGGEWLAPGVGMQTWWNSGAAHGVGMEVYNVSYATVDVVQAAK
ncbi:family 16 glycosylhydrolase [Paracraurococcus lichenis]|uniref:Family 16 glycosylhydrolase n=1 Tax=Paracraurococcus lichenis TaxID=3064888 RepID=A0ABT9E9G3_9PROT|nr:family 16 glycosylhydrolase [Paracraurococcus sp. LOR1-02]MDO9712767.1 family 16 glycosylhydrolase [Paracraurococcus sp. LOR1-02]